MATQMAIDFNPTVSAASKPRLAKQHLAILDRLREGPALNTELVEMAIRYSARIHELRNAGYVIDRETVSDARGVFRYRLVEAR